MINWKEIDIDVFDFFFFNKLGSHPVIPIVMFFVKGIAVVLAQETKMTALTFLALM